MKLIIESGSTKADWRSVSEDGTVRSLQTAGINPLFQGSEEIRSVIGKALPQLDPEGRTITDVFFYGAGVVSSSSAGPLLEAFGLLCPLARIECDSDMIAAARALFGDGTGVAAILGTGSNSCMWADGQVVSSVRSGGYVLGDEGSGAVLGKLFLADYIKGIVPEGLAARFHEAYGLDYPAIVSRLYSQEGPSRFLGSFARFVIENKDDDYASGLIRKNLVDFIERVLMRYGCREVGIVGSMGIACRDELMELGRMYGLDFVRFIKSPIEELVRYHGI